MLIALIYRRGKRNTTPHTAVCVRDCSGNPFLPRVLGAKKIGAESPTRVFEGNAQNLFMNSIFILTFVCAILFLLHNY